MVKRVTIVSALLVCLQMFSESEFEKFAKKFAPPKEAQEIIEQNKDNLEEGSSFGNVLYKGLAYAPTHLYGKCPTPSCWHVSGGISRIINAYRMANCIKRYNLSLLNVPQKYIYFVNDRWHVFTDYIRPDVANHTEKKLSDDQIQQVAKLVEETGYEDFGCPVEGPQGHFGRNIMSKDGKLFFIDTENHSFMDIHARKWVPPFWSDLSQKEEVSPYISGPTISHTCRAQYLENLYKHLYVNKRFLGSDQLRTMLQDRLDYLWHHPEGMAKKQPLHISTEFDDADINFKKARQELKNIEYYGEHRRLFDNECVDKNVASASYPSLCKQYIASMMTIDKKLQEKYGAQPRKDMEDPKRQEAAAYWQAQAAQSQK